MWRLVAPRARRTPISDRRSSTETTIMLAIPMPPTSRATPPRPSSRAVSVSSTASRAARASEGRDTSISSGAAGLAVAASTASTASTASGVVRTCTVLGDRLVSKSCSATSYPMNAALSRLASTGTGSRMPITVNHWPPR